MSSDENRKCSGVNGPTGSRNSGDSFGISKVLGFLNWSSQAAPTSDESSYSKPAENVAVNKAAMGNNNLQEHLKKCAGLGNLPPLYEKCEDIPGYKDRVPKSSCGLDAQKDKAGNNIGDCPPEAKVPCKKQAEPDSKCPPMPCSDCSACVPEWLKFSTPVTKPYPVPPGVMILPISQRKSNGDGTSCKECGQTKPIVKGKKMNPECPAVKVRIQCQVMGNQGKDEKSSGGIFAKIASFFKK